MVRAAHQRTATFYIGCGLWTVVAGALIYLDLGVIAFVASIILAIWVFGLREKFASDDDASAYSVFNRNGLAITGGFTAQQFDRQMRGGFSVGMEDDNEHPGSGVPSAAAGSMTAKQQAKIGDSEKLRRRRAAAAAAENRFSQQ
jgi:hypothetical protein